MDRFTHCAEIFIRPERVMRSVACGVSCRAPPQTHLPTIIPNRKEMTKNANKYDAAAQSIEETSIRDNPLTLPIHNHADGWEYELTRHGVRFVPP